MTTTLAAGAEPLIEALRRIAFARDHNAAFGDYPRNMLGEDQEFDDWAADVAQAALEAAGVDYSYWVKARLDAAIQED